MKHLILIIFLVSQYGCYAVRPSVDQMTQMANQSVKENAIDGTYFNVPSHVTVNERTNFLYDLLTGREGGELGQISGDSVSIKYLRDDIYAVELYDGDRFIHETMVRWDFLDGFWYAARIYDNENIERVKELDFWSSTKLGIGLDSDRHLITSQNGFSSMTFLLIPFLWNRTQIDSRYKNFMPLSLGIQQGNTAGTP